MVEQKKGWIEVGELLPQVSVHEIAAYFRFDLGETFGSTGEQRTRCPVTSCDGHEDYRSVSINMDDEKGRWKCHRSGYGCGGAGDKLTFIHCLATGGMPTGGKLTGRDFRSAAKTLQEIAGGANPIEAAAPKTKSAKPESKPATIDDQPNTPLSQNENESIRRLATLDEQLIVDVADMTPAASRYVRSREWMTPEFMRENRCGYLPSSAKGTLRGYFVFGVFDEQGEALAWIGRDLNYAKKVEQWERQGRKDKEPAKYRFPSRHYFRRKFEIYGQEQLNNPEFADSFRRIGLTITEGFNDVLRLRALGVPSVGIMSNRMTSEQVAKSAHLARELADGKLNLMFDANPQGDEGAKETLWQLAQSGLNVKLSWSSQMYARRFRDWEPESITSEDWNEIEATLHQSP